MLEIISLEDAKKIMLRQQEDLQRLTKIIDDASVTIRESSGEITRLLKLCSDHEKTIAKLNEVICNMHAEQAQEYRVDASRRGERLD